MAPSRSNVALIGQIVRRVTLAAGFSGVFSTVGLQLWLHATAVHRAPGIG
jgi:hypothetical protein